MPHPYSSGYFSSDSSLSLPGAWCSAWSLPQQYPEHEMTLEVNEIKNPSNCHQASSSSNSSDLGCPEPTDATPPNDAPSPPGASYQQENSNSSSELQSTFISSQDDAISGCDTFPGEYSHSYSFCSSQKMTSLSLESNVSLETLSLYQASISNSNSSPNSTSSRNLSFSSELGGTNQETIHSCNSFRKPMEITRPSSDNNTLFGDPDTLLDNPHKTKFPEHIPRDSIPSRNCSSELCSQPLLLLSQPDGNNTWTLSLDPTISRPGTISESSVELESSSMLSSCASDHDEEAIANLTRATLPSAPSTPKYNEFFLSLPPPQGVHDIAQLSTPSDVSMIVSSISSVQHYGELSHDFPVSIAQDCVLDPRQPSRSKKLVQKSKEIFSQFKRLFTSKGTEAIQAHTTHFPSLNANAQSDTIPPTPGRRSYRRYRLLSTKSVTPSFGRKFRPEDNSHTDNGVDEKYTYEYHARPKTLQEIKSQRRFSLPTGLVGTPFRATPSTKHNVTPSVPRSQSRPMSMYTATANQN